MRLYRGYTLVELIVAIGLFSIIMMIASGAYLIMINASRNAQGATTGINNLSYALETMTRAIRTGSVYGGTGGTGCESGGATSFTFHDVLSTPANPRVVTYSFVNKGIQETRDGVTTLITDVKSLEITQARFYCTGAAPFSVNFDYSQPHVIIIIEGKVAAGPGKDVLFNVQTAATMRGADL